MDSNTEKTTAQRHASAVGSDALVQRVWFCATSKSADRWEYGGDTQDAAINAGLDLWGGENRPDGFWIAPAHESDPDNIDDCDPEEGEYTVEADKAEWIPLR
jgi:hypothetical protein